MHACDIIAYHTSDGEVLCADCGDEHDKTQYPIFGDNVESEIGSTCADCRACYIVDGYGSPSWEPAESFQSGVDNGIRWAICTRGCNDDGSGCNHHYPVYKPDAATRLQALRGDMACPSCHGELHF